MMFSSHGNPLPQQEDVISAGYLKSAFPKAVRLLNDADIELKRKALFTISVMLLHYDANTTLAYTRLLRVHFSVQVPEMRFFLSFVVGTLDQWFIVRSVDRRGRD